MDYTKLNILWRYFCQELNCNYVVDKLRNYFSFLFKKVFWRYSFSSTIVTAVLSAVWKIGTVRWSNVLWKHLHKKSTKITVLVNGAASVPRSQWGSSENENIANFWTAIFVKWYPLLSELLRWYCTQQIMVKQTTDSGLPAYIWLQTTWIRNVC